MSAHTDGKTERRCKEKYSRCECHLIKFTNDVTKHKNINRTRRFESVCTLPFDRQIIVSCTTCALCHYHAAYCWDAAIKYGGQRRGASRKSIALGTMLTPRAAVDVVRTDIGGGYDFWGTNTRNANDKADDKKAKRKTHSECRKSKFKDSAMLLSPCDANVRACASTPFGALRTHTHARAPECVCVRAQIRLFTQRIRMCHTCDVRHETVSAEFPRKPVHMHYAPAHGQRTQKVNWFALTPKGKCTFSPSFISMRAVGRTRTVLMAYAPCLCVCVRWCSCATNSIFYGTRAISKLITALRGFIEIRNV